MSQIGKEMEKRGVPAPCQLKMSCLTRMSHKSSTALRYVGTGADFVGFHARASHRCMPSLRGVDPASTAHLLETRTSTRPPFTRYEFYEKCGLEIQVAFYRWLFISTKIGRKPFLTGLGNSGCRLYSFGLSIR